MIRTPADQMKATYPILENAKQQLRVVESFLTLVVASVMFSGCAGPETTVKLFGTPGAKFAGFYTVHGVEIDVTGEVPTAYHFKGEVPLDAFELKKANPTNVLTLEIYTAVLTNSLSAGPGTMGIKLEREGERFKLETF